MGGRRARTRTFALVAAALVAANLFAFAPVAPAGAADPEPFVLGTGNASGSVARARLFYGGLTLPMGIGTSSASYTNSQARALGIALDAGAYVGLATDVPESLRPVAVDSNNGDKSVDGNVGAGETVGRVRLTAKSVPLAQSEVRMSEFDLPALVKIEGAHSISTTEIRDKKQRRSTAVVSVAKVTLANAVVLTDLRWEVTQATGFEPTAVGKFVIGGVAIGGVPVDLPPVPDVNAVLTPINTALERVGLRVEAPKIVRNAEGGITMAPLRVALADSELGEQLLGPAIAALRPIIAPVMGPLVDANSTLGLVGLVADIVLGVADGSGGMDVLIGGASASTSATAFKPPTATPDGAPAGEALPEISVGGGVDLGGLPTGVGPDITELDDTPQIAGRETFKCALEAAPRREGDCREGHLGAAVAISAVAIVGLVAAEFGVRRRRRAASEVAL